MCLRRLDYVDWKGRASVMERRVRRAYVKHGNWYYSTPGDEGTLAYVLDCIGDNGVVFGSSYPATDSAFPSAFSNLKSRGDISEASKRKIFSDNARRLFGLQ